MNIIYFLNKSEFTPDWSLQFVCFEIVFRLFRRPLPPVLVCLCTLLANLVHGKFVTNYILFRNEFSCDEVYLVTKLCPEVNSSRG